MGAAAGAEAVGEAGAGGDAVPVRRPATRPRAQRRAPVEVAQQAISTAVDSLPATEDVPGQSIRSHKN